MANARHGGMGAGTVVGHPTAGKTDPDAFDETNLSDEIHGRNSLQGQDQARVHNERQAMANVNLESEDVMESFERLDEKEHTSSPSGPTE